MNSILNSSRFTSLVGAFLLAITMTMVHGQNFDFNNMMNQNCPNFKCSSGYTPVPKSRTKFESTGCSAMGGGSMMVANPGGSNEKLYESCCHQWHACYQVCGVSKKTCDNTFETCAKKVCDEQDESNGGGSREEEGEEDNDAKGQCTKDVELSTMMMKLSGCKRYDEAQLQVCECALKDKADDKKETAIRNFYKKNAPENVNKAQSLVAKADTPAKLAGLFIKLLLKYPDAITIKEDPMQAMFDKIKTESSDEKEAVVEDGDDVDETEEEEKIEL